MTLQDIIKIAPGAVTIIIAILASIEAMQSRRSIMWVFTYLILGAIALGFMFWQQRIISDTENKHNSEWKDMQDKVSKIQENNKLPVPTKEYDDKLNLIISKLEKTLSTEKSGRPSLKAKASLLSSQILRFLSDRTKSEPSSPRPEYWNEDTEKIIEYFSETVNLFPLQFGARVIAIRNEFVEQDLQNKELDKFYEHPTNLIGMRIVAERIGALAERLP
jgi:hypothetical protein